MIFVACIRATFTGFSADRAMLIIVFFALFRAKTASLLAYFKELLGKLRVSHYESGSLETNISAIAGKFDATCHHGNVLLVQTPGSTRFTCERTIYQFLNQAGLLIG
jgi:hypothetical protein